MNTGSKMTYTSNGEVVTIIIVCYNCHDDMLRTLDSVRRQSYREKEIVVVDGGSKDGTPDYLAMQKDLVWVSESDDGIYDAMNKGLRMATGEWVIFMNSGDMFTDNGVLTAVMSEEMPADTTFIYSDYSMKLPSGGKKHWTTDREKGIVHHQSSIYRRRLHEVHGYYQVTHPYIISDLLFFLSVPSGQFFKTKHDIALIDGTGISSGRWSAIQSWGLHVVYGYDTIPRIFYRYLRMQLGYVVRWILRK